MTALKTALLKLKTEASERRDEIEIPHFVYPHPHGFVTNEVEVGIYKNGIKKGFDSRQTGIDTLISVIEKQSEALANIRKYSLGSKADTCDQCESDVLALLSGIEGKV